MTTQNDKKRLADYFRTEYGRLLRFVKQRVDDIAAQDAEDIIHDLSRLMADLNDDEKKLIIATVIKGKTFSHLSKKWNVPINTLLSRKSRAMAKIRRGMNLGQQMQFT